MAEETSIHRLAIHINNVVSFENDLNFSYFQHFKVEMQLLLDLGRD